MKTLVFIGSDNIGDAFLTYQVIDALSYAIPDIAVHLYHKNHFNAKPLFVHHPNIKNLGVIKTKLKPAILFASVRELYKDILSHLKDGDVYISSLLGSGTVNILLKPLLVWNKLFGKNKIITFAMKPLLNGRISKHILDFHYDVLSQKIGVNVTEDGRYPLLKPQVVSPKTVGIVAGASGIWKCWQAEKFVAIIQNLLEAGFDVKLLGSNNNVDSSQAEAIMQNFRDNGRVVNLVGKTSLFGYFEEIQRSCYIITNNSSAQHIANAGNVPCAVLWGRHPHDRVVHAYSYTNKSVINIFNEPYRVTLPVRATMILTGKYPERSKKSMVLNYADMSVECVWNKVKKHMQSLSIMKNS